MIPLCVYLYFVIRRILKIFAESKNVWLQRGLSALLAVLVTMPAFDLFGLWAAVLLHFAVISAMIDIIPWCCVSAGIFVIVALAAGILPVSILAAGAFAAGSILASVLAEGAFPGKAVSLRP